MSTVFQEQRNVLVPMRDGVQLAADFLRPAVGSRVPALLNFGPYHKDGRGGRLAVDSVHRHFAALGYAGVSADLRGLGNSGGVSPKKRQRLSDPLPKKDALMSRAVPPCCGPESGSAEESTASV